MRVDSGNGLKIALIIGVLLISFSVFYYLVIFLPQKSNQQLEQKVQFESFDTYKQVTNQQNLENCLNNVDQKFANMKLPEDKMRNLSAAEAKVVMDSITTFLKQAKDDCYKKYPTK